MSNRCAPCHGSGKIMGGGMIYKKCEHCKGKGKIEDVVEKEFKLDKNSVEYKKAKDNLKKLDANMSDAEVEKLLDEELEKPTKEVKKRGRKKKG